MTAPGEADQSTAFFTAEQETPNGWRLPLRGNLISYRYFRQLDFAFEVWVGDMDDMTVRLERPFTYGRGEQRANFDPRTSRKSDLAPLLGFETTSVDEFLVTWAGELSITLSDGSRLVAPSAEDGHGWSLDMPGGRSVRAASRPGTRATLSRTPTDFGDTAPTGDPPAFDPMPRDGVLVLPIRGVVTEANASGVSIELIVPIEGGGVFCTHFGGAVQLSNRVTGVWEGACDAEDQTSLGPMLGFIGSEIVGAGVGASGVLTIKFQDGPLLTAAEGRWESHWPDPSAPYDERWVPREGPNIP